MRDVGWQGVPGRASVSPAAVIDAERLEEMRLAPPGAKQMRRAYGFDEVAIVPGDVTINPELVDVSFALGEVKLRLPFLAAGMDAVVSPRSAAVFSQARRACRPQRRRPADALRGPRRRSSRR